MALARALVRRKPVLLLDEPFAALDPGLRAGMIDLLLDLHRQEGHTILVITHHPDDVRIMADSVLFLDKGRIILARDQGAVSGAFRPCGCRPLSRPVSIACDALATI